MLLDHYLTWKIFRSLDAIEARVLDPNNPWLQKLLEFQKFLVNTFTLISLWAYQSCVVQQTWQALCWVGEG